VIVRLVRFTIPDTPNTSKLVMTVRWVTICVTTESPHTEPDGTGPDHEPLGSVLLSPAGPG